MHPKVSCYLTPEQAEENPRFANLLSDLFTYSLSENETTKSLNNRVTTTEAELKQLLKEYQTLSTLYDKVWDIVNETHSTASKTSEEMFRQDLEDALIEAEMKAFGETGNCGSLLTTKTSNGAGMNTKTLQWLSQKLKQDVTIRSEKVLPKEVQQGNTATNNLNRHFEYLGILVQTLSCLESSIKGQLLEHQLRQIKTEVDYAVTKLDSLLLKMQALKLEILCETYKKETVSALTEIKKQAELQSQKLLSEIELSDNLLSRYSSIGQEFNNLVAEYTNIKEHIKQKSWTLQKLQLY